MDVGLWAIGGAPRQRHEVAGTIMNEETSIKRRGEAVSGLYSATIARALTSAMALESKLPEPLLQMDGMSGRMYRRFINNLVFDLPDAKYLEIGSWAGSTACAAMYGNCARIHCIDNWSEFGGPREQFLKSTAACQSEEILFTVQEMDFRRVDYASLGKFNVYLFDGPHTYQDQYDGIRIAAPALDPQFVLIVDDWNWGQVRKGTYDAIRDQNMTILYSVEIRTTQDGGHPKVSNQNSAWHNGYFLGAIQTS